MITTIKKHGNGKAIVIPKAILDLLNITDETQFRIDTDGVTLTVQSIGKVDAAAQKIMKKHHQLYKNLAER